MIHAVRPVRWFSVVLIRRSDDVDRECLLLAGAPRGPYVRACRRSSRSFWHLCLWIAADSPPGKPLHAHKHFFPRGKTPAGPRHSVAHPDIGFSPGESEAVGPRPKIG